MSEITGTGIPVAHEAYAFACMRCGYGWEQAYDIEHHIDAAGKEFIVYKADGERVPSPLSKPTCMNCGGHVVRMLRAGQVSSVQDSWEQAQHAHETKARKPVPPAAPAAPVSPAGPVGQDVAGQTPGHGATPAPVPVEPEHHWHLSDLLHPFHRK